jgi:hypothetical protein
MGIFKGEVSLLMIKTYEVNVCDFFLSALMICMACLAFVGAYVWVFSMKA